MKDLNTSLFLLINAGSKPPTPIFQCTAFLAEWLFYGVPLLLLAMWLWGSRPLRKASFVALLAIFLGLLCNQVINAFWPQPRPFMITVGHTYLAHRPESSFPSDHSTLFFAFAVSLWLSGRRMAGVSIFLLGALVGSSRLYLGLHFPFDVFGALLVGGISALAVVELWKKRGAGDLIFGGSERVYRRVFVLPITKGWVRE